MELIENHASVPYGMSILSNVDFIKSTFDKIDIIITYKYLDMIIFIHNYKLKKHALSQQTADTSN